MGCVCQFFESVFFKRVKLICSVVVGYIDVGLDITNACKLFYHQQYWWASCMTALLFVPNAVTWLFLNANGSASRKEFIYVLLQLGPARQFLKSWRKGESTVELMWYVAAEGLGEAPLSAMLTAYIVTFGSQTSITYYASFVWSFITISKAAVALDYYGQKPSFPEQIVDFMNRLPLVALRISTLACFGFLMKQPGEDDQSTQTALPAWLIFSLVTCVFIITAAEPRCPLSVSIFFGATMMFTSPMRFLSVFERMHDFFIVYRYGEIFVMTVLAVSPLAPNQRLFELAHNAPMLLYIVAISFALAIAWKLTISLYLAYCKRVPTAKSRAYSALDERAEAILKRIHTAVDGGDALMTNLLASVEGANLADPFICRNVLLKFPSEAQEALIEKGMPADLGELIETGRLAHQAEEEDGRGGRAEEAIKLKLAGYSVRELRNTLYFSLDDLYKCGYTAHNFKEAGLDAKHLIEVGVSARQLVDAQFSAESLKAAYPASTNIKDTTDVSATELKEIGIDAKTLHDWCFETVDLLKAGFRAADIARASFDSHELAAANITVSDLREAGLSASELKELGFEAKMLQEAGFTAVDLKENGFDTAEIAYAGFSAVDLNAAGINANVLRAAKLRLTNVAFSAADLKLLGFKATDVNTGSLTAVEMVNAGFEAKEIVYAIKNPSELKAAGLTAAKLKKLGMNASELKQARFEATDLREARFEALEMKKAGFTAQSLKSSGFSASELKSAGFQIGAIAKAKYSSAELQAAGLTAADLRKAKWSAKDMKGIGFPAADLKCAGFTAKELIAIKFTLLELKEAGFTLQDLQSEFDSIDLLKAGFDLPTIIDVIRFGTGRFQAWQKLIDASTPADLLALARVNTVGGAHVSSGTFESPNQGNWLEIRQHINLPWKVAQLKEAGLEPSDLIKVVNWKDLKRAGWSGEDFRDAIDAAELAPGYSPAEGKMLD